MFEGCLEIVDAFCLRMAADKPVVLKSFAILEFTLLATLLLPPLPSITKTYRLRVPPPSEKDIISHTRHAAVVVKFHTTSRRRHVLVVDTLPRR